MKHWWFAPVAASVMVGVLPLDGWARTWTEAGTGRTLEGELIRVAEDQAVIRRANGATVQVPLARLSEADQAFLKQSAAGQEKPAAAADVAGGKNDLKTPLLGTWQGIMVDREGSRRGEIRLVITEAAITASDPRNQRVMGTGTYSVSREGSGLPRMDATGTSGQFQAKKYAGIFSVEGKTLKWCSANENPRSTRPEKLESDPASGHFLMVLEKES